MCNSFWAAGGRLSFILLRETILFSLTQYNQISPSISILGYLDQLFVALFTNIGRYVLGYKLSLFVTLISVKTNFSVQKLALIYYKQH